MESSVNQFTKEFVKKTLDILRIPYADFGDRLHLGSKETDLLPNDAIMGFLKQYFIIGTDGTSSSLSDEEIYTPGLIVSSAVAWGLLDRKTKTYRSDQRYLLKGEDRESNSGFRTMLELWQAICILKASKLKKFDCAKCPFRGLKCTIKSMDNPPWNWYVEKEGVALVDLPVEFKFVEGMRQGTYTKVFFQTYLKEAFKQIRKHKLCIIFITHKSTLKVITKTVISHLDAVIDSMDQRATALIDSIALKLPNAPKNLSLLPMLSMKIQDRSFFDFDLLESWFDDIARPSPSFKVVPSELNDNWEDITYFYLTWGYKETINDKKYYAPSCWIRVGHTPFITPEEAHLATCLEMILGKGHSVVLTLAHTACNENKELLVKILTEQINHELSPKQRIGLNVKQMNKWRLMKNG